MYYLDPDPMSMDIFDENYQTYETDEIEETMPVQSPIDMRGSKSKSKGKARFEQSKTAYANIKAKCTKLGQAYVPDQPYCNLISLKKALHMGTIFADLYDPYYDKNKC